MAAAPALLIGGAAFSALGAISQANSQASMLQNQAASSNYNAALSRQQAEQALTVSTAHQLTQRRTARQALASQRAAAAQSGTGMGGSNNDIMERSEALAELDALNIAYEGSLRSRGYAAQADIDDFQARVYQSQVKPTKRAGYLSAIGGGMQAGYLMKSGRVS